MGKTTVTRRAFAQLAAATGAIAAMGCWNSSCGGAYRWQFGDGGRAGDQEDTLVLPRLRKGRMRCVGVHPRWQSGSNRR